MLTQVLFKISKILKFNGEVASENSILVSKSLHKTLPKILCDWFTLSFVSHTYNTRWVSNGCINVSSHHVSCKWNICLKFFAKSALANPALSFKNKAIERFDY